MPALAVMRAGPVRTLSPRVKRQLTREIAEGRFRGSLETVKREIDRRVKERMIMSRNNNYTRLATASP
ncbi:hypothetical protein ECZU29_60140 [Escherichia coli]|nr:hypothetical protein ECZU29_60140 [Escherichia coli]